MDPEWSGWHWTEHSCCLNTNSVFTYSVRSSKYEQNPTVGSKKPVPQEGASPADSQAHQGLMVLFCWAAAVPAASALTLPPLIKGVSPLPIVESTTEVTSFSFWCHCHLHTSFVLEAWRAATATCLQQVVPWIFPHKRDGVTLGLWCELFKTWRAYTLVCRYLKVSWNPVLVQYIRSKHFAKYRPLPPALKAFQRHVSIYCLFRGQQEREDLITSFTKKNK